MSVLEYEYKFNELLRFTPEVIPTKADMCQRFEEGLWLDIQVVVTVTTYPSMRVVAQTADRVTKKLNAGAARRHRDIASFGGPSQGPSKMRGSSSGFASSGRWSGRHGTSSSSRRSELRPN